MPALRTQNVRTQFEALIYIRDSLIKIDDALFGKYAEVEEMFGSLDVSYALANSWRQAFWDEVRELGPDRYQEVLLEEVLLEVADALGPWFDFDYELKELLGSLMGE